MAEQIKKNPYDESAKTIADDLRCRDVLTVQRQRDELLAHHDAERAHIVAAIGKIDLRFDQ